MSKTSIAKKGVVSEYEQVRASNYTGEKVLMHTDASKEWIMVDEDAIMTDSDAGKKDKYD